MDRSFDVATRRDQALRKARKHLVPMLATLATLAALGACGGGSGSSGSSTGSNPGGGTSTGPTPSWGGFGRDAQHSDLMPSVANGGVAAQNLNHLIWETPVDTAVTSYNGNQIPIHYGSPIITSANTVIVPVKTSTTGSFVLQAQSAMTGTAIWTQPSDYVMPPQSQPTDWIPSFGPTLAAGKTVYMPGAGGKVIAISNPDARSVSPQNLVFYGSANYGAAPTQFNSTVYINTPITSDTNGNIFFGFVVTGSNPAGLVSGVARIDASGNGTWVAANAAVSLSSAVKPAMNAAPALSNDGATVYVSVVTQPSSGNGTGYLVALDSTSLATKSSVALMDPYAGTPAQVSDFSSASPVIGPDGDVYYGVLETTLGTHNYRGWLLHFNATLSSTKTPGSFGWDNTPSIVPATLVTSYHGMSTYLLLTKYNNYAGAGTGDGHNKMAILDPNATETDPIVSATVMNEVMTVLGPTADTAAVSSFPGAVKEWCVNSSAVDTNTHSALMNSEDGFLYRWDLNSGTLSQKIWLDNGYGQAYTPTAIGPDGTVYAINNANLIAVTN
jgi:hypothetical protein